MKKLILIALMGIALFGCKKDDASDNGGTTGAAFTATVDGTNWTPVSSAGIASMNILSITALDTKTEILIVLPQTTAKGDYDVATATNMISLTYTLLDKNEAYVATAGKITVSSNDAGKKKITGSFDVTVTGITATATTHKVKGTFSITYMQYGK